MLATILFSLLPVLYADDGQSALSLSQIDELIAKTDYNTALDALSLFMAQYPNRFDAAQKRVDKILKNRREYNRIAEQLLQILETGDDGEEKSLRVLEVVAQLDTLEKNPTDKNIAFIRQAKMAALFTVYRARYYALMEQGSESVRAGQYVAAAYTFREGFALYRPEFEEADYDAALKDEVYRALADISAALPDMQSALTACTLATEAFTQAVTNKNVAVAKRAFPAMRQSFADYAALRNRVAADGAVFATRFSQLQQEDPELTDASFLGFARRFTLGRASDADSGIVGAMDAFWTTQLAAVKTLMVAAVQDSLQTAVATEEDALSAPQPTFDVQRAAVSLVQGFAALGGDVQRCAELFQPATARTDDFSEGYALTMDFIAAQAGTITASYDAAQELSRARAAFQTAGDAGTTAEAVSAFVAKQVAVATRTETTVSALRSANQMLQEALADERFLPACSDSLVTCQHMNETIASLSAQFSGTVWASVASACARQGEASLLDFRSRTTEAQRYYDGVPDDTDAPDESSARKKYPDRAITLCERLATDIARSRAVFVGWRTTLDGGVAYRTSEPEFERGTNELDTVIRELDALSVQGATLAADARTQVQNAERASNEARLRYNEAVAALQKGNFDGARDALQKARTKYNESLSYQESDALRTASDDQLAALGAQIAEKENEIVVRDVRELKNAAKNAYYAGDFETAENRLIQAKTRWAVTNVDDDQEITNLLALVTTALSMKTGRVIPPTAPLYPEMSQILSISNQYYNEGAALITQGKRSEATKRLLQAKEKLHSLQLVYPLNQEASLLNLRIDLLIDASAFNTAFAQKIENAKQDYKDPSTRQRAYSDLLDLYEINPSYPGLSQLIYEVEIAIGVRQKPVDTSALVRSKNLSDQAQRIYASAGRNETQLRSALALLDEAISLNPENDAATVLKDRIQIAVGGKASVVLSSADEAMYQRAIQDLQKNNIVGANDKVEQLLQKPANRRSAKILDLQKRVKALL